MPNKYGFHDLLRACLQFSTDRANASQLKETEFYNYFARTHSSRVIMNTLDELEVFIPLINQILVYT